MKKLMSILAIAGIAASVWATAPASNTVSTTSVVLVPKKPVSYTTWTTNTAYAQGAVVKSGTLYYMTTDGGVTTNAAPTHTSGEQVATGGGISWRNRERSSRIRRGISIFPGQISRQRPQFRQSSWICSASRGESKNAVSMAPMPPE